LSAETPMQRLEQLASRPGVSPDLLALEGALLAWRRTLEDEIRARHPRTRPDPATLQDALRGPGCLAALSDPLPEPALLDRAAVTLAEVLHARIAVGPALHAWLTRPHEGQSREHVAAAWFSAAWRRDRAALAGLAADGNPGAPGEPDIEVLEWSGRQLCRPFFHRLGELLAAESGGPVEARATCPSCGGPPRFSRLERDEGRRFLWCDLCNVQWPFRRVTCPFCGNTDQTKLGYLTVEVEGEGQGEGQDQHRIDVCEVCRCYLRAANERVLPEGQRVDFLVEDLAAMHLCLAAEGQGYRPGDGKPEAGLQGEG